MVETLLVIMGLLALTGLALTPWVALLQVGAAIMAAGLAFGVPAGWQYHVRLRRELGRLDAVEPRWWWQPTAHHHRLDGVGWAAIQRPFHWGAAGCGVIFIGAFVVTVALVRSGAVLPGS